MHNVHIIDSIGEETYLQILTTPGEKMTQIHKQADRISSKSVYILYAFGRLL
jgi:hypothetical protein